MSSWLSYLSSSIKADPAHNRYKSGHDVTPENKSWILSLIDAFPDSRDYETTGEELNKILSQHPDHQYVVLSSQNKITSTTQKYLVCPQESIKYRIHYLGHDYKPLQYYGIAQFPSLANITVSCHVYLTGSFDITFKTDQIIVAELKPIKDNTEIMREITSHINFHEWISSLLQHNNRDAVNQICSTHADNIINTFADNKSTCRISLHLATRMLNATTESKTFLVKHNPYYFLLLSPEEKEQVLNNLPHQTNDLQNTTQLLTTMALIISNYYRDNHFYQIENALPESLQTKELWQVIILNYPCCIDVLPMQLISHDFFDPQVFSSLKQVNASHLFQYKIGGLPSKITEYIDNNYNTMFWYVLSHRKECLPYIQQFLPPDFSGEQIRTATYKLWQKDN